MKNPIKAIGAILILGLSLAAQASVITETSHTLLDTTYGNHGALDLGGKTFLTIQSTGAPGSAESFSYTVSLAQGQSFGGLAAYDNRAVDPTQTTSHSASPLDLAQVLVGPVGGLLAEVWSMDSVRAWDLNRSATITGNCLPVNWQPWNFTAPVAGDYTIEYSVTRDPDSDAPNNLIVKKDSFGLFAPVPEPSTWVSGALLGCVALFGCVKKTRRSTN